MRAYLKQQGYDLKEWDLFFEALNSFSKFRYIDDYAYKLVECTPECLLDDREKFKEFEYFSVKELKYLQKLYLKTEPNDLKVIDDMMDYVNQILGANLYTTAKPPEAYSLSVLENEVIPYMKKKLTELPNYEYGDKYSINENDCWGIFENKSV